MKLIEDVKGAWRHFSTIALASGSGVQGAWVALPDEIKSNLPKSVGEWVAKVTCAVLLWGLVGKFIKQADKPKEGDVPDTYPS